MIKVLLFDVDGVLITGDPFTVHLAHDHGITQETTAPFFQKRFTACLTDKADLRQELSTVLPEWGWKQSVDDLLLYWFTSENNINTQLLQAIQLMRQQGMRCYLATNQEKYRSTYIWKKTGFEKKFDGIFSSAQVGHVKSEPAFFQHISRSLENIPTQEILFWDDNKENIAVARKAGLQAELYTSFADFIQKTALHIMPAQVK